MSELEDLGRIYVYSSIYPRPHEGVTSVEMAIRRTRTEMRSDRVALEREDLKRLAKAAGVEPWSLAPTRKHLMDGLRDAALAIHVIPLPDKETPKTNERIQDTENEEGSHQLPAHLSG